MVSKHPAALNATPTVSSSIGQPGQSRRSSLAICLAPILLLGATCAGAAIQRQVSRSTEGSFGHMSRAEACQVASDMVSRISGSQPTNCETSTQSAFSVRRHSIVREWSVLCTTNDSQYLLRINADTGRVYGINRMDDNLAERLAPTGLSASIGGDADGRISHAAAEARARDYIGLVGMSSKTLTPVIVQTHEETPKAIDQPEPEWNFTFRNGTKPSRNHLVTISVRSTDGRLEHLWNPVLSL